MTDLRVGVAGLGVAFAHIASALRDQPQIRFTAAMDTRPAALDAFRAEFGGRTYDDFDALCADPNVDVVYIASPNPFHAAQAIAAAKHRKHIVVDKPMALTVAECEAMNRAAYDNGVVLCCGHLHSYDTAIRAMRALIVSGKLGRLRAVSSWHFNDWIYRPRAAWELNPANGGNVVFNQGAHQVDIARLLAGGMARSVMATAARWDAARPIEGAYSAYMDFTDGTVATLVYNGYAHFDSAEFTEWAGEMPRTPDFNAGARARLAAMSHASGESAAKDAWRFSGASEDAGGVATMQAQSLFGITIASCEGGDVRQTPGGLRIYDDLGSRDVEVPHDPGFSGAALMNLYEVLAYGRPLLRDGRWGAATIEVLQAIMHSSETHAPVLLAHQVAGSE